MNEASNSPNSNAPTEPVDQAKGNEPLNKLFKAKALPTVHEPSHPNTLIVPEDGLHQGFEQLKARLGPKAFLDKLLAAIPLNQDSTLSNPTQDN